MSQPIAPPAPIPAFRRYPGSPPSVVPTILFTLFFGIFGAISAARRASEASRFGKSITQYWVAFGVVLGAQVLLLILIISTSGGSPSPTSAYSLPAAPPATTAVPAAGAPAAAAPAPAAPAGPATKITDGTFVVGTDIAAGTWHTTGGGDGFCGWSRLTNTSGDFSAIIANGVASGPTTVTVKPTDNAFSTMGGCTWTKTG